MTLILNCQQCGEPLPPIDTSTEDGKLVLTKGVELKHDVCPADRAALELVTKRSSRRFEARVDIFEVTLNDEGGDATTDKLAGFRVAVDAASLTTAMRPLATALGVKWMEVEEHAPMADIPNVEDLNA